MSTQATGRITLWKAEKGYGFITPDTGGKDVFFHVRNLHHSRERLAPDVRVYYDLAYDEQQRPLAIHIQFESEPLTPMIIPFLTVSSFFIVLIAAVLLIPLPAWLLAPYSVMSVITFFMYGSDKDAAIHGRRRIPEKLLHRFELLGGWPGALLAQEYYHHKSSKGSYQIIFWVIVVLHVLMLTGIGIFAARDYSFDFSALSTW